MTRPHAGSYSPPPFVAEVHRPATCADWESRQRTNDAAHDPAPSGVPPVDDAWITRRLEMARVTHPSPTGAIGYALPRDPEPTRIEGA